MNNTQLFFVLFLFVYIATQNQVVHSAEINCYVSNADSIKHRDGSIQFPFASVTQCINYSATKVNENNDIYFTNEEPSNIVIFVDGTNNYNDNETWDLRLYSKTTVNLKITRYVEQQNEVRFNSNIFIQLFKSNIKKSTITVQYLSFTNVEFNSEVDEVNLIKKSINIIDSTLTYCNIASQSDAYNIMLDNINFNTCNYQLIIGALQSNAILNNINDLLKQKINCSSPSSATIDITVSNLQLTNSTISAKCNIKILDKSIEVINNVIYNSFSIVGNKLVSNTLIKDTNFQYSKLLGIFYHKITVSTMNNVDIKKSNTNHTRLAIQQFNSCNIIDVNFSYLIEPLHFTNGNKLLIQHSSISSSDTFSFITSRLINTITLDDLILSNNTNCVEFLALRCNELIMKNCNFITSNCYAFAAINDNFINNVTLLNNQFPTIQCGAGYYSPNLFYSCKQCQPGTMNNESYIVAVSKCKLCSPGSYTPYTAQDKCLPCEVGTYQDKDGSTSCKPCPNGLVATSKGSLKCKKCTTNSYYVDSNTCVSCNIFTTAYSTTNSNVGCHLSTTTIVLLVLAIVISLLVIVGTFGGTLYVYKKRVATLHSSTTTTIDQYLLSDNNYGTLNG